MVGVATGRLLSGSGGGPSGCGRFTCHSSRCHAAVGGKCMLCRQEDTERCLQERERESKMQTKKNTHTPKKKLNNFPKKHLPQSLFPAQARPLPKTTRSRRCDDKKKPLRPTKPTKMQKTGLPPKKSPKTPKLHLNTNKPPFPRHGTHVDFWLALFACLPVLPTK